MIGGDDIFPRRLGALLSNSGPAKTPILDAEKLTTTEAAKLLKKSPRTLQAWQRDRRGPRFYHPRPGAPFYLRRDLEDWLASGAVECFDTTK